jgi:hypothetical protein
MLVVCLAMVAGYVFSVQLGKTPEVPDEPPWFYSVSTNNMTGISITDRGEEAAFYIGEDNKWHIDEPNGLPVGTERWEGIALLLSGPKSRRLLDEQPTDLAPYGLDSPLTTIDLELKGDQTIGIILGLTSPDGESTYAQLKGFDDVFTVFSGWTDIITGLITDTPYPEWYYNITPSNITRIELLTRETGVALDNDGSGWRFDDENKSLVDETQLLASLQQPLQALVEYEPFDLAQYGLDVPSISLFFQTEKPDEEGFTVISQTRFLIGSPTKDGTKYYVQTQRGTFTFPDVFSVNADWVDGIQSLADNPPYLNGDAPGN